MRVTNKMLSNSFLSDMRNNLANLQTLQQQMTSGKEISKPSDDPAKVARAMQLHTDINANNKYKENISDTSNWLDTTDTALGQAGDVLQRVRELLVSAGNAAYGSDERQSIKNEINQKIDEFAQVLNTTYDGKYLFGGTRGTVMPMTTVQDGTAGKENTKLVYNANGGDPASELKKIGSKLTVELAQGVNMDYNVSASDVVKVNDSKDLRDIFSSIVSNLDDDSKTSELTNGNLQDITDAIDNLLKVRSEVGAKQNRMESTKQKNEDETFNMTSILSRTEDIDITQKTMEYATLQTVYMASLQTSAKVLQPTLLDYLR